MSAAIKYLHSAPTAKVVTEALAEVPRNNVSYFEAAPEQRLRRALDKIRELQEEIKVLRDELSRSERSASHYERLLKNALVREQELKVLVGRHLA
jgi:hypothetical protein